ncbi:MAG: divergent polysaccharide deacetylase family protein [bacterium]
MLLSPGGANSAELAIVIDDVGYHQTKGMRAIALPGPVTIAVLPHAPHTAQLVERARFQGKDIIVHQPMQAHPSKHASPERRTLMLDMHHHEFASMTAAALDAVPGRIGLSNHTGSLLTAHREPMRQLMTLLRQRDLFFLDSRTTAATVALDVAREQGVPAIKRDVFLDHDPSPQAVHHAFERALDIARRNGRAVLIGHPYDVSLDYLEGRLADLPADIKMVSVAQLAQRQAQFSRPAVLAQPPRLVSPRISPGP